MLHSLVQNDYTTSQSVNANRFSHISYAFSQLLDRGKTLEENLEKLDEERRRSEELLYRMMPKAVADRLRDGQKAVETCEVLWRLFIQ